MSTPTGPFLLVQNTPNNPPGTSLLPLSEIAAGPTGTQDIALVAGDNNDLPLLDETQLLTFTGDPGGSAITGIQGGEPGRVLYLWNRLSAVAVALDNEDAASAAANRLLGPTGLGVTINLATRQGAVLVYDGTALRWTIVARSTNG